MRPERGKGCKLPFFFSVQFSKLVIFLLIFLIFFPESSKRVAENRGKNPASRTKERIWWGEGERGREEGKKIIRGWWCQDQNQESKNERKGGREGLYIG